MTGVDISPDYRSIHISRDWWHDSSKTACLAGQTPVENDIGSQHTPQITASFGKRHCFDPDIGGHRLVVMPALDLVLVHRVDTGVKEHEVTSTAFGRLLALLLEAAPSA